MLQAWMILPALVIGYLLTAPIELRRRVKHVAVAGAVTLAVSLSWIALYTFTPASARPYVDGSTNNSAFAMVFGYNGLGRVGINLPGAENADGRNGPMIHAKTYGGSPTGQAQNGGPSGGDPTKVESRADPKGWHKLLDGHLGVAIGWLFPLALLSLLCGLWWWRRAERTDPVRGGMVMWGVWLLTFGLTFSAVVVPHTAYVASLAPPVAALSGLGIVMFWRAYQRGGRQAWILPLAIAAEMAWCAWLWSHYPNFLSWALWGTLTLGVIAIVALVLARVVTTTSTALVTTAFAIGVAAMLAAPATYAVSVLDPDYSGASYDANAGPASGGNPMAPGTSGSGKPGGGGG
jgi:4-amino-4-deoxy-L-arabinose transferase-like glycosyltransferase